MRITQGTAGQMFVHQEWYDHRDGRQIVGAAVHAAAEMICPEAVWLIHDPKFSNPLDHVGEDFGEAEMWWCVPIKDVADWHLVIDRIRAEGLRVKTAGLMPDDMMAPTHDQFFDWFYTDIPDPDDD